MTPIVLGEAGEEFAESVQYYESKEVGLGARFRDEVVEAVLERSREQSPQYRRFKAETDIARVTLCALSRINICLR